MLYDHRIPDTVDVLDDVNYSKYCKVFGNYSRRFIALLSQFVKKLDDIATRAPRRIVLVVDAASVQVTLGRINNAAAILVKSKITELVELAEKMLARADEIIFDYDYD